MLSIYTYKNYILKKSLTFPPKCCTVLYFSKYMYEIPGALYPTNIRCYQVFYVSYSCRCSVISHCGFNFHFPDDSWCWVLHVLIAHSNTFFVKYLSESLAPSPVLRIEHRALHLLGKGSTTETHPEPLCSLFRDCSSIIVGILYKF